MLTRDWGVYKRLWNAPRTTTNMNRPDVDVPQSITDLKFTFGYHCNLACTFCLVEDALGGNYKGIDLADAEFILRHPVSERVHRVIFSGGEVTLEADLPKYIELARRLRDVREVRLETNATQLADPKFLGTMVDAGVNEFFVSLHGHDAAICDAITQKPGSFERIMGGIENIAKVPGVALITNTCIVRQNYRHLRDIAELVAAYRPQGMEYWNYLPRVDHYDTRDQLVPIALSLPHLVDALRFCRDRATPTIVKHYPRCVLGEFADRLIDWDASTLADDKIYVNYPDYGCIHEQNCDHAMRPQTGCRGLAFAYVRRFGWEEELLTPTPRSSVDAGDGQQLDVDAVREVGLDVPAAIGAWKLVGVHRENDRIRFTFESDGRRLNLSLEPRDDRKPRFAQTRDFNIVHSKVEDSRAPHVVALLTGFVELAQRARREGPRGVVSAPAAAWDRFVAESWGRKPTVLRGVVPRPMAAESEILATIQETMVRGERMDWVRVFADGRRIMPPEYSAFRAAGDDLAAYVANVTRALSASQLCIEYTHLHELCAPVGARVRSYVHPLIERVGLPVGRVDTGALLGTYTHTPFGVHRDIGVSVLQMPIAGTKRLLAWEPSALSPELIARHPAPEDHQSDAIVLEGGPGDMIYWPADWWHTNLSLRSEFHASVGTAFWLSRDLRDVVLEVLRGRLAPTPLSGAFAADRVPAEIAEVLSTLERAVAGLSDDVRRSWLERSDTYDVAPKK